MPGRRTVLLVDAYVLIDYQKSDISILGLAARHVGEVRILTTILEEVEGLDAADCERIGLTVVEPELHQVIQAAARRGPLSFHDHLCLIVAEANRFVCVTNDKTLRKRCEEENLSVLWGLEVMTALVRKGALQAGDAIRTAEKIHAINPLHIPAALVDRFTRKVAAAEKKGTDT